jgi:hypothetical protein
MVLLGKIDIETRSEKFKMAATKTGCTCTSASIQDSKEIPTDLCMFLGSENSVALLIMLYLETGSETFKDGGCQTGSTRVTAFIQNSKEIHLVFRVGKLNDAIKRLDVEVKVTHLTIK